MNGDVVGAPKLHSWGKYTMPLTNINSDWMSNASSGLCIILILCYSLFPLLNSCLGVQLLTPTIGVRKHYKLVYTESLYIKMFILILHPLNAYILKFLYTGSSPVTFPDLAPGDHTVRIRPDRAIAQAPPLNCRSALNRVVGFSIV